jgi:hypothetical protein
MSTRLASCSCGQLTAQVAGEPVRISICHCLACQRRTGSVFGASEVSSRESVDLRCLNGIRPCGRRRLASQVSLLPDVRLDRLLRAGGIGSVPGNPCWGLCRSRLPVPTRLRLRVTNAPVGRSATGGGAHTMNVRVHMKRRWLMVAASLVLAAACSRSDRIEVRALPNAYEVGGARFELATSAVEEVVRMKPTVVHLYACRSVPLERVRHFREALEVHEGIDLIFSFANGSECSK